ncbi:hypothetical protein PVK06_023451 [Gossypium arboreum]|uniref:Uncharacterized protein n=1 Tax=Gossypium arboreum TaxID=29729 RepID=A0ABR0PB49_GOSAR|nr:hypothetical protein PVK06_023451 [Gossypium arboreum]
MKVNICFGSWQKFVLRIGDNVGGGKMANLTIPVNLMDLFKQFYAEVWLWNYFLGGNFRINGKGEDFNVSPFVYSGEQCTMLISCHRFMLICLILVFGLFVELGSIFTN